MAKKMSDGELSAILDGWVTDARSFDRSDLELAREWAIKFYDGACDIATQEGRSQVVSHDVADALEWILPALLRIFTASATTAIYEPVSHEDEIGAKQATACINYLFQNECEGYRILHHAMHDSLLHGNGPIKSWFEHAKEYKVETVRGLNEMEYQALLSEPDLDEVLEVIEYPMGTDVEDGEEITPPLISEEEGEGETKTESEGNSGGIY